MVELVALTHRVCIRLVIILGCRLLATILAIGMFPSIIRGGRALLGGFQLSAWVTTMHGSFRNQQTLVATTDTFDVGGEHGSQL